MTIRFTIPGPPVGKGRPRFVRATGRTYTPEKTASYESLVKMAYTQAADGHVFDGPVVALIDAYYQIPASLGKKKRAQLETRPHCPHKPDADNLAKVFLDSLNGSAWRDDSCVTTLVARKRYDAVPRVEVLLEDEREVLPFCGADLVIDRGD
jgi:Holliday junction resolvase RusA-like endonuclease